MKLEVYQDSRYVRTVLPRKRVQIEDASLLARLTTGERSRLWVLAIGSVLVLVGLLPPSVVAGR